MKWLTTLFTRAARPAARTFSAPDANATRRGLLKRLGLALGGGLVAGPAAAAAAAPLGAAFRTNSSEPFIGEIMMFGGNFPPRGWAFCDGQLLSIAQNSALFAILGTTFGGNGQTTFALPDLRGRLPMHAGGGLGPGLTPRTLGEMGGQETVTLITSQMPPHTHSLNVSSGAGSANTPAGNVPAVPAGRNVHGEAINPQAYAPGPDVTAAPTAIGVAGGGQPINNLPPFLAINYCIALEGIFPSRN